MISGESRCLDAFTVALSKTSEGADKRWYVPTLEQATVPMYRWSFMHERVNNQTPRTPWSSRKSFISPEIRYLKEVSQIEPGADSACASFDVGACDGAAGEKCRR